MASFGGHLAAYARTLLVFPSAEPELAIPLWEPLTRAPRERLARLGLGGGFVVVTAENPRGELLSAAQNASRAARLAQELARRGCGWLPADGCSPERRHRERGVAVRVEREQGRELALRFEQLAFYRYDGECFWLCGALCPDADLRLPLPALPP